MFHKLHQRLFDDAVATSDTQFQNYKAFARISREKAVHYVLLVVGLFPLKQMSECSFNLLHTGRVKSRQLKVRVAIGGKDEMGLVADYRTQIVHHLRRAVVFHPILHQSA